jgi:hypothetical protein
MCPHYLHGRWRLTPIEASAEQFGLHLKSAPRRPCQLALEMGEAGVRYHALTEEAPARYGPLVIESPRGSDFESREERGGQNLAKRAGKPGPCLPRFRHC